MPKLKITNAEVSKISKPENGKLIYWDSDLKGFGLRATPTALTYIVQSRVGGKQICTNIGRHGVFTPTTAREKAKVLLGQMVQGVNPNQKQAEERVQVITLQEVYDQFKSVRNLREGTIKVYDNAMKVAFKDWAALPIIRITKDMVEERHKKVSNLKGKRGKGEALANQSFRFLRTVLNYAMAKYEIDGKSVLLENPVRALTQRRTWNKNRKRTDVISPRELSAWYQGVQGLKHSQAGDLLLLCLLTGLRRKEALTLKWEYINFRAQTLSIPDEVVKTGKSHTLPLTPFLVDLLEKRSRVRRLHNPYVFVSDDGMSHMTEPKSAIYSVRRRSNVKFSLHTLRRTFETTAESLEIPYFCLKALLNHRVSDVTSDYVQITTERLRKPMGQITEYFLQHFEDSSGLDGSIGDLPG